MEACGFGDMCTKSTNRIVLFDEIVVQEKRQGQYVQNIYFVLFLCKTVRVKCLLYYSADFS